MLMDSQGKFHSAQNISGASWGNSVAEVSEVSRSQIDLKRGDSEDLVSIKLKVCTVRCLVQDSKPIWRPGNKTHKTQTSFLQVLPSLP